MNAYQVRKMIGRALVQALYIGYFGSVVLAVLAKGWLLHAALSINLVCFVAIVWLLTSRGEDHKRHGRAYINSIAAEAREMKAFINDVGRPFGVAVIFGVKDIKDGEPVMAWIDIIKGREIRRIDLEISEVIPALRGVLSVLGHSGWLQSEKKAGALDAMINMRPE